MLLEASDPEIFAVKVEVDFYFEMEEVLRTYLYERKNFVAVVHSLYIF